MEATPISTRVILQEQPDRARWLRRLDAALRRLFDLIAAAAGLLLLSPIFAAIALLVRRDSPGPVFYWGRRVGRDGRPFRILKFRTMYERPESYAGPKVTGDGDSRITPIGAWLRDTKLNELPQLWNVLRGHMSLVGPRPEDPTFVARWPQETRRELLSVRPGVTSPASVIYRDEEALLGGGNVVDSYLRDILPSKLRLDLLYVRHRTIFSDLDIIFWTLIALLPRLKGRRIPEHSLFWGPVARLVTRHFSWFVVDLLTVLVAVAAAGLLWRSGQPLDLGLASALGVGVGIAFIFSWINVLLGLNRVYWSKASATAVFDLALSIGLATALVVLANHFWPGGPLLPGGLLLVTGLLAFLGFVAARYRIRIITGLATRWVQLRGQARAMGERVLIVGAGEAGDFAAWLLRKGDLARAFAIVGLVDDAPRKQGVRIDGLPVLGHTADIPDLVARYDIGLILFAIVDIAPAEKAQILALCRRTPAHLVQVPAVLETLRLHFDADGRPLPPPAAPSVAWLAQMDALLAAQQWDAARAHLDQFRNSKSTIHNPQSTIHNQEPHP